VPLRADFTEAADLVLLREQASRKARGTQVSLEDDFLEVEDTRGPPKHDFVEVGDTREPPRDDFIEVADTPEPSKDDFIEGEGYSEAFEGRLH
jgi:hypothetical protein